jgi:hypothetical protein
MIREGSIHLALARGDPTLELMVFVVRLTRTDHSPLLALASGS